MGSFGFGVGYFGQYGIETGADLTPLVMDGSISFDLPVDGSLSQTLHADGSFSADEISDGSVG